MSERWWKHLGWCKNICWPVGRVKLEVRCVCVCLSVCRCVCVCVCVCVWDYTAEGLSPLRDDYGGMSSGLGGLFCPVTFQLSDWLMLATPAGKNRCWPYIQFMTNYLKQCCYRDWCSVRCVSWHQTGGICVNVTVQHVWTASERHSGTCRHSCVSDRHSVTDGWIKGS